MISIIIQRQLSPREVANVGYVFSWVVDIRQLFKYHLSIMGIYKGFVGLWVL